MGSSSSPINSLKSESHPTPENSQLKKTAAFYLDRENQKVGVGGKKWRRSFGGSSEEQHQVATSKLWIPSKTIQIDGSHTNLRSLKKRHSLTHAQINHLKSLPKKERLSALKEMIHARQNADSYSKAAAVYKQLYPKATTVEVSKLSAFELAQKDESGAIIPLFREAGLTVTDADLKSAFKEGNLAQFQSLISNARVNVISALEINGLNDEPQKAAFLAFAKNLSQNCQPLLSKKEEPPALAALFSKFKERLYPDLIEDLGGKVDATFLQNILALQVKPKEVFKDFVSLGTITSSNCENEEFALLFAENTLSKDKQLQLRGMQKKLFKLKVYSRNSEETLNSLSALKGKVEDKFINESPGAIKELTTEILKELLNFKEPKKEQLDLTNKKNKNEWQSWIKSNLAYFSADFLWEALNELKVVDEDNELQFELMLEKGENQYDASRAERYRAFFAQFNALSNKELNEWQVEEPLKNHYLIHYLVAKKCLMAANCDDAIFDSLFSEKYSLAQKQDIVAKSLEIAAVMPSLSKTSAKFPLLDMGEFKSHCQQLTARLNAARAQAIKDA